MKINKWMVLLILLSIIGTILVYSYLPNKVPSHWNIAGEIDAYQQKTWVFFTAVLPLVLYMLMVFLPKIDPKKDSYLKHQKAYTVTQLFIVVFMIFIHWITVAVAMGYSINIGIVMRLAVGILFIILGNYLGQIRQNYFFGIKTPWTLANEQVWKKTHRMGGYVFVLLGILMAATVFLSNRWAFFIMMGGLFASAAYVLIYSYFIYKKVTR